MLFTLSLLEATEPLCETFLLCWIRCDDRLRCGFFLWRNGLSSSEDGRPLEAAFIGLNEDAVATNVMFTVGTISGAYSR